MGTETTAKRITDRRGYHLRLLFLSVVGVMLSFMGGLMSVAVTSTPILDHIPTNQTSNGLHLQRTSSINLPSIEESIHAAANYLVEATFENGQFQYRVDPDQPDMANDRYNVLRHCGTIFSLTSYHREFPNQKTLDAIQSQAEFLQKTCLRPLELEDTDSGMMAIWSDSELTGARTESCVKLGGLGLGLVALTNVEQLEPGTIELARLQGLGKTIVFMQKTDGSFYSKYFPKSGRSDRWTSLYYPGEAILGLALLYDVDPQQQWLEAAARGMKHLAQKRTGLSRVEADHWALLATRQLLLHQSKIEAIISREMLVSHAEQICQSILDEQYRHPQESMYAGCFTQDGRTCPTATRLEGLLAAQDFLNLGSLKSEIDPVICSGVQFLQRAQISSEPHAGGIPRAISSLEYLPADSDFNRRANEIRIDYVQHALSALLDYYRTNEIPQPNVVAMERTHDVPNTTD